MYKYKNLLVVILGGWFGLHKFLNKETGMGILYLFTFGLFGIGWIIDIIKEIMNLLNGGVTGKSLMPIDVLKGIDNDKLTKINTGTLNLEKDEFCYYADKASIKEQKTITTGYSGKNGGFSFKIMNGIHYRTGSSEGKAIKQNQTITYNGLLYITNKRIIFTSNKYSFDKAFDKITSIMQFEDGVNLQIGSKTYTIYTNTARQFIEVFNLVK